MCTDGILSLNLLDLLVFDAVKFCLMSIPRSDYCVGSGSRGNEARASRAAEAYDIVDIAQPY